MYIYVIGVFSMYIYVIGVFSMYIYVIGVFSVYIYVIGVFSMYIYVIGVFSMYIYVIENTYPHMTVPQLLLKRTLRLSYITFGHLYHFLMTEVSVCSCLCSITAASSFSYMSY